MVGKITDNRFLSGSLIPALMDDNPFKTPNTVLTDILGARKVAPFKVQEVKRTSVMKRPKCYIFNLLTLQVENQSIYVSIFVHR